jgi:uncharacterized RDD family membrane protein YckC
MFMTVNQTRPVPVRRIVNTETVVEFTPDSVKAPLLLRIGAAAIDYILIVGCPVLFLIFSRLAGNDGAALLNSELNNIGWLVAVLVAISNQVALPVISGRTVGKLLTGITVVDINGRSPSIRAMFIRQTIGYLLIIASAGLGFLTSVFSSKGRALHDYLAGTVVIYGEKVKRSA